MRSDEKKLMENHPTTKTIFEKIEEDEA